MINVQTLGTLLRTLQSGELAGRGVAPLQPLAPTQAVKAITPEGAQSAGTRDPGQGELRPTAGTAPRSGSPAATSQRDPLLAMSPARTGALVLAPSLPAAAAEPSAVVILGGNEQGAAARLAPAGPATAAPATALPPAVTTAVSAATAPASSLSLSPAAQLVDTLTRLPGGRPIEAPAPLLPAPAAAPEALARALQQSIVASGLFYESHLARWTLQRHPEPALRAEPQAAWPPAPPPSGPAPPASGPGAPAPALPPLPALDTEATVAGAQAGTTTTTTVGASGAAGLPDAAPALVRQQLDVLETGQILWRGDLWPGQRAAIEIVEDDASRDPRQPPAWRTRLALTLPGLGAVEARLALAGTRVHLHLVAADRTRATVLRDALPELAAALAARGLDVAPVTLDHGPGR
jgi:hypothetical protein